MKVRLYPFFPKTYAKTFLLVFSLAPFIGKSQIWSPATAPYSSIGGWFEDPAPAGSNHGVTSIGVLNFWDGTSTNGSKYASSPTSFLFRGLGLSSINSYVSNNGTVTFYEMGGVTSTSEAASISSNSYIAGRLAIKNTVKTLRIASVWINAFNDDGVASGSYSYSLYVLDLANGVLQKLTSDTVVQATTTEKTKIYIREGVLDKVNYIPLTPGHTYEFRWYFYNRTLNYQNVLGTGAAAASNSIAIDNPQFFIQEADVVILPLSWLNVSGNVNATKQAVISWKVNETNVAKYEIEKSSDGRTFISIANINSKGDGENTYRFSEAASLDGIKYYRIKQIDNNGRYSYSSLIKLSNQQKSIFNIYPNPVKDQVTINATAGTKATLSDISGKVLQQIIVTAASSFTVDMSKYSRGIYILKTDNGITQKMIKE